MDRTEQRILENSPLLPALLDNIPSPVYCQDVHGFYLAYNKAFQDLFRASSPEEYIGKSVFDLPITLEEAVAYHKADLELFRSPGRKTFEGTLTFPDGSERRIISTKATFFKADGSVGGIVTYVADATKSHGADEELRRNEARSRYVADASPEAVIFSEEGIVVDVNRRVHDMFGYGEDESLGLNVVDLVVPYDQSTSREAIIPGDEEKYETKGIKKDGTIFPIEVHCRELDLKGKRVRISTVRDLTERKSMEEEVLKWKNLQSLRTLAGGIAHDFNNLLMAVVGNVSLAKMNAHKESKIFNYLSRAEAMALMGKSLTEQILAFSNGTNSGRKILDIGCLVEETTKSALSGSMVKSEHTVSANLFPAEVDEEQIRQVVHNIIINAKESMSSEGVISVTCENVYTRLEPGSSAKKAYVRTSIHDQGVGISDENMSKIFDPYFTTKEIGSRKGVGLGLAICYSIVKRHEGYILVDSIPGKGTTFQVYLPAHTGDGKEEMVRKKVAAQGRTRVLVMDDEEVILKITEELLQHMGYDVTTARNGEETIRLYKEAMERNDPFSAVILDLEIAGGMGGREAMEKLMALDPNIKAVVSSGYLNDPAIKEFKDYGFSDILPKPYDPNELDEKLRCIMRPDCVRV